ncbi:carbon-nitrogen hydrolase [Aspergillus pseudoustus]|uniref:nitrilase n=1 Tax=Aspergillus pseudoustus TaxID=1810923 RepID=A0ABR4IH29_9EURO
MTSPTGIVKVAVPQVEPAWLDLDAGIQKTVDLINEAALNGAQLIAFSECWIPGYPGFLWSYSYKENIPFIDRYIKNSVEIDSAQFRRVQDAAARNKIHVMFGFVERYHGSLFMAQTLIGPDGAILMHRHKTKPTHVERTLFGEGSGDSIRNVAKTELGNIGALQCWEHLQPLLKYHTYAQHEHIHIAAWPTNHKYGGWEPWSFSTDAATVANRLYAMESQAFVIVATQTCTQKSLDVFDTGKEGASHMSQIGGGFTAIYAPDGRKLTEDVAPDWEGILYADLDMSEIAFAKSVADPVGHYSRSDLFQLHVDTRRKEHVVYRDSVVPPPVDMIARFVGAKPVVKKQEGLPVKRDS